MDKRYPTDEEILFLVCESVRVEANNKLSLLGTYMGGDIIFGIDPPANLGSLTLIYHARDGVGKYDGRVEILVDDESIKTISINKVTKEEGRPASFIVQISPMQFKKYGNYVFRLWLDDKSYDRKIVVKKGKLQQLGS